MGTGLGASSVGSKASSDFGSLTVWQTTEKIWDKSFSHRGYIGKNNDGAKCLDNFQNREHVIPFTGSKL